LVDRDVVDLSLHRVMELHHRAVSREQLHRFEGYLAEIFAACGLNLNTPATEETPRRFLQALFEATEGYDGEPKLRKVFDTECRGNPDCRLGQVIEGPIPFFALCEHHALPFFPRVAQRAAPFSELVEDYVWWGIPSMTSEPRVLRL
jgi:GTP cyclohydrolase IA